MSQTAPPRFLDAVCVPLSSTGCSITSYFWEGIIPLPVKTSSCLVGFGWVFFGKVFQVNLFELIGFSTLIHFPLRSSSHSHLLLSTGKTRKAPRRIEPGTWYYMLWWVSSHYQDFSVKLSASLTRANCATLWIVGSQKKGKLSLNCPQPFQSGLPLIDTKVALDSHTGPAGNVIRYWNLFSTICHPLPAMSTG